MSFIALVLALRARKKRAKAKKSSKKHPAAQQQSQAEASPQEPEEPEEILGSDDEEQEDPNDYCKGGYHHVKIGDLFNGRYHVIRKLGWGHFSTVRNTDPDDPKREMVVQLLDDFKISGINGTHVCMVFEVLGHHLLKWIIKSNYQGLPLPCVKSIIRQVTSTKSIIRQVTSTKSIIRQVTSTKSIIRQVTSTKSIIRQVTSTKSIIRQPENILLTVNEPYVRRLAAEATEWQKAGAPPPFRVSGTAPAPKAMAKMSKNKKKKLKKKQKRQAELLEKCILDLEEMEKAPGREEEDEEEDPESPVSSKQERTYCAPLRQVSLQEVAIQDSTTCIAGVDVTRLGPQGIITAGKMYCNGKEREEDQHNGNTDPAEDHGLLQESNPQESNPQESNPQESKKESNGQESPPPQPVCNGLVSPETEEPETPESEEWSGALTRKMAETETTSFRVREEEQLSPEEEEHQEKNQDRSREEVTEEELGEEEATELLDDVRQYGEEQESLKDAGNLLVNPLEPLNADRLKVKIADLGNACWVAFELATGDYLFEPHSGEDYARDEDHLALIIELLGKVPRHYALSGKFSQEYFTRRDHIALIIELLGQVPRKLITAGKYSKDFFTKKGDLKHITKLKPWGLLEVLQDKYEWPKEEADCFADFLLPMLELVSTTNKYNRGLSCSD
ncbi:unnamed protein product [Coregonus sp. 'balchen']|nr:unnamed protein product [Coregonus sp. 'balchen']